MPGYLAVTDERTLTPDGVAAVAKNFPLRSEVSPVALPDPPAYAGDRDGLWIAPYYNPGSPSVVQIAALVGAAKWAGRDINVVTLGDSKTEGARADTGKRPVQSWPGVLRRMLGGVEGFVAATDTSLDDRWAPIGMSRAPFTDRHRNGLWRDEGATSISVTFTPGFTHTGGTFWVYCAAGGSVDVTVDGGAPQAIAVPAGNGYKPITPTVSGDTAHTYVITSSDDISIYGITPTYSGPRIKVSNFGRDGAHAVGWVPGFYADGTSLWDAMITAVPSPDAVMCQLGTNVPETSEEPIGEVWAAIAALAVPAVVIAPGGLGGSQAFANFAPIYRAAWDAADAHNLPLVDFQSVIGDYDAALALGYMGDVVHESPQGYAGEAAAVLVSIGGAIPAP